MNNSWRVHSWVVCLLRAVIIEIKTEHFAIWQEIVTRGILSSQQSFLCYLGTGEKALIISTNSFKPTYGERILTTYSILCHSLTYCMTSGSWIVSWYIHRGSGIVLCFKSLLSAKQIFSAVTIRLGNLHHKCWEITWSGERYIYVLQVAVFIAPYILAINQLKIAFKVFIVWLNSIFIYLAAVEVLPHRVIIPFIPVLLTGKEICPRLPHDFATDTKGK